MTINQLANIVWTFYNGRNKSTNVTISEAKMAQYCKLGYAAVMRNLWLKFGNKLYAYTSNVLSKEFDLTEPDMKGRRFINMGKTPTIALPDNMDIFNIEPINEANSGGCKKITMVQAGEDAFYEGISGFPFAAKKGKGIQTYNIPDCIKKVSVEAVYDDMDLDMPQDILFDVSKEVLGLIFEIKKYPQRKIDDQSSDLLEQLKIQMRANAQSSIESV